MEEQALKYGVTLDAVLTQYDKLFPGVLYPTLVSKKKTPKK